MCDIVGQLVKNKQTYLQLKRDVMKNAEERCKELDIEIERIDEAIQVVNNALAPFL